MRLGPEAPWSQWRAPCLFATTTTPATPQRRQLLLRCRAASSTPPPPASTARSTQPRQQPNVSQRRTFHRSPPRARKRRASEAPTRKYATHLVEAPERAPPSRLLLARRAGDDGGAEAQAEAARAGGRGGGGEREERRGGGERGDARHGSAGALRRGRTRGIWFGRFPPLGSERRAPYPLYSFSVGDGASREARVLLAPITTVKISCKILPVVFFSRNKYYIGQICRSSTKVSPNREMTSKLKKENTKSNHILPPLENAIISKKNLAKVQFEK